MGRTPRRTTSGDPVLPLGLLVVGLLSLCAAVLYPMQRLLDSASPTGVIANSLVFLSADTAVVVLGCLTVSAAATTLGVVMLIIRL